MEKEEWKIVEESVVEIEMDNGVIVKGRVAHVLPQNFVTLKQESSGSQRGVDLKLITWHCIKNCKTSQPATSSNGTPSPLPQVDLSLVDRRLEKNLKLQEEYLRTIGDNVTLEAQNLFTTIRKTLTDTVWDGANIVVMSRVMIRPNYSAGDVTFVPGSSLTANEDQMLEHVKKVVDDFHSKKAVKH